MPTEHRNDHGTTRKPVSRSHRKTDRTMNHNRSKEPVGENHHTYKSGHSSVPKTKKYPGLSSHEAGDSWENPSYYGHELAQTSKSDIAESAKSGSNPEKHGEEVSREITSKRRHHKIDSGKKKTFSSRISGEHKKEITHIKVKIPGDSGMMERRESTERMIKRPTDNRNDSNLCSHNLRPNDEEEVTSTAKASAETENAKKCIERMDKTLAANEGENKLRCVSDDLAKENDIKSRSKECFKVSLTHEVEGENSCSLNSNDERKEAYRVSERQDSDYEEYTSDFDEVAPSSSSSRYSDNDMSSKEKYSVCFSNAVESQQPTGRDNSNSPQLIDFNRSLNDSRHRIQQRLKQRASDLRRLIELELDSCISVFDLRPLDEYSNYMLRFGKANRNQVQSQTQDDAIDRDVQTDPIEYCSSGGIWTQWPPLDSGECWGKYDNSKMGPTLASSFQASQNTDSLPDTYLDDVIKDFTNIYDTQPELKACKRETGSLPSSLLSLISLVLAILNEEQVPELVQSHDERHIVTGETNYVRSVSRLDQNDAESEPTVPQPPLPGDSGCVACAFAPHNGDTLLTIHRPTKIAMLNPLNDRTGFVNAAGELIYVWSISSGSGAPKHQLYCPGLSETGLRGANITRAIFSPDTDASMVVGGLADGSLCIWDLRASRFGMCPTRNDPVRSSDSDQSDYRRIMFAKAPIYSTSGVDIQLVTSTQSAFMDSKSKLHEAESRRRCSTNEVHRQHYYRAQSQHHSVPIVDVQLTPSARCDPCLTTFQFAALDESGELSLWMVLRPARSTVYNIYESLAGSQTDLGLRPAEHVVQMVCLAYLIPTLPLDFELGDWSTMEGVEEVGDQMLPLRDKPKINATTLALSGSGDFLLGFNNGAIVRLSRSSKQSVYPRQFGQPWNRAAVRCLAVHSIAEFKFFLAGYADGFIRMYHINQPEPVYERNICDICDCQLSAVKLIWSTSRPSIFFCLDSSGRITSLDMVEVLHEGNMDEEIDCAQKHTMASVNQGLVIHVPSAKLEQQRVYDFALSRGVLVSSNGQTQIMSAFALIYPEAVKIHWLDSQWSHGTGEELKLTRDRFSQL